VQMPEMDGLQVTRILMEKCPTCVVIVTGRGKLEREARLAGAMSHVMKPVMVDQIPGLVESARQRFDHFMTIHSQSETASEALQTWLLLQELVALRSEVNGFSEEEALRRLQRAASERGLSLRAVAEEMLREGPNARNAN